MVALFLEGFLVTLGIAGAIAAVAAVALVAVGAVASLLDRWWPATRVDRERDAYELGVERGRNRRG